jgi:endonuclease III
MQGSHVARISASKKFARILPALEEEFGRREAAKPHPPVEQALVTVLLKKGKEQPAMRAIKRIQRGFVDLNEARVSDPAEVDQVLGRGYPAGVGRVVVDTLTAIFNHAQAMNLDDVVALDPDEAEGVLRRMNPLPSRVAGELLLYSLDSGKLPEGAGMLRVARRAKLIRKAALDSQMRSLRRIVPKKLVARAFHAFEMLAERTCTPKAPHCPQCPINDICPTGIETLKRLAIQEKKEREAREAEQRRQKERRDRERKVRERKRAATARLKKTIQARSKKLKLSTKKGRRKKKARRDARMAQMSSADVPPDQRPTKKKRKRKKRKSSKRKKTSKRTSKKR